MIKCKECGFEGHPRRRNRISFGVLKIWSLIVFIVAGLISLIGFTVIGYRYDGCAANECVGEALEPTLYVLMALLIPLIVYGLSEEKFCENCDSRLN